MTATIGEQLKQAREGRQISLAQAAEATRVKLVYLQALENNDLTALPSRVQGKGFLRIYADFLGLPLQPLLDLWDGKITASLPAAAEEPVAGDGQAVLPPASQEPVSKPPTAPSEPISQPIPPPAPAAPQKSKAQDLFNAIGRQLAQRRQALGLSLDEVEHHIKVRSANLLALEEGRISDLPSPVQARGMLSNYATFLDLNVDAVLLSFAEALQIGRDERLPAQPAKGKGSRTPARPQAGWRRFLTPDLIIGGGVIIMLFVFAVWTASRINSQRLAAASATAPSVVEAMLNTNQPTQAGTLISTVASIPGDLAEGNPTTVAGEPSATPTTPIIGSGAIQIYVVAHQRSWVEILADGKVIFNDRIIPGNAYTFAAKTELELRTGNAAGVQVFYNQTDLGILGLPGQIKTLLFSQAGAVTPTPRFTATPTPQPTATQTPQPSPTQPTPTITPFIP